jgi:hypothetical protein
MRGPQPLPPLIEVFFFLLQPSALGQMLDQHV